MSVTFRGFKFDPSTVGKLELAEKWIGVTLAFAQGSYSSGVAASGGTHDGGGAVDVKCIGDPTALKVKKVHYLRAVGFDAWHRPYNWDGVGGGEHIHCIERSNTNLSQAAKNQLAQWNAGDNGLANHARDTDSVDTAAGRPALITQPPVVFPPASLAQQNGPDNMIVSYPKKTPGKTYTWHGDFILSGSALFHIVDPANYASAVTAGLKVWNVSYAQWLELGGKA